MKNGRRGNSDRIYDSGTPIVLSKPRLMAVSVSFRFCWMDFNSLISALSSSKVVSFFTGASAGGSSLGLMEFDLSGPRPRSVLLLSNFAWARFFEIPVISSSTSVTFTMRSVSDLVSFWTHSRTSTISWGGNKSTAHSDVMLSPASGTAGQLCAYRSPTLKMSTGFSIDCFSFSLSSDLDTAWSCRRWAEDTRCFAQSVLKMSTTSSNPGAVLSENKGKTGAAKVVSIVSASRKPTVTVHRKEHNIDS